MNIIYYSKIFFSDCDFPLIREFQRKNKNIFLFFHISESVKKGGIINIKDIKKKAGIYKASDFVELNKYSNYIDLEKIFIINSPYRGLKDPRNIFLWLKVYLHMRSLNAKIFHFTWQLSGFEHILYFLDMPRVMTVHDPISHSHIRNHITEKNRIKSFKKSSRLIILNKTLKSVFSKKYNIPFSKISLSRMGEFNHLKELSSLKNSNEFPYILFFGIISPYKGVDYLCEAMIKVHQSHPNLNLIIAGSGKIYFDISKYSSLPYIRMKNYYIDTEELSSLLQNCLFCVCPYKDATQSGVIQTAFSTDTPVIASNVGALKEAITDGQNGLLIPPMDVNALANAIISLVNQPELLNKMRENINKIWRPTMGWETISNDYLSIYDSIYNEKKQ